MSVAAKLTADRPCFHGGLIDELVNFHSDSTTHLPKLGAYVVLKEAK